MEIEQRVCAGLREMAQTESNKDRKELLNYAAFAIEKLMGMAEEADRLRLDAEKALHLARTPMARPDAHLMRKTTLGRLTEGELLWMEINPDMSCCYEDSLLPVMFLGIREEGLEMATCASFAGNHYNEVADYGAVWRLWDRKPSEEKRQQKSWDDPDEWE